jgi:ATP-dependent DNA helicase RecQ
LFNHADITRLQESTALHYPPESYLRQVYQSVVEYLQIPIGCEPDQYYSFDIPDFCQKFSLRASEAIHALKLLEQEGLWTLTESVYRPATVHFTTDRHTLEHFYRAHPGYEYFIVGLLRMYNTIFHFPTAVREFAIAKQLRIKKEEAVNTLIILHRMGILQYSQPGEGPQMYFHHYRVDSRHLAINSRRINALRQRHEARTEAMVAFLENNSVCRERLIVSHFGEEAKHDCGHCDVCRDKADRQTDPKILRTQLLETIKRSQGISLSSLTAPYTPAMKVQVVAIVRKMIDEGVVRMDGDRNIGV